MHLKLFSTLFVLSLVTGLASSESLRGHFAQLVGAYHNNVFDNSPFCGSEGPYYGVVVDAASSGSRIRIFTWDDPKSSIVEVVAESDREHLFETNPGLSSYADNGGKGAGESLSGLLSAAKTLIPEDKWSQTPMYVLATAGLRMLSDEGKSVVLADTTRYLQNPANCPFDVQSVRIITGKDEGLYAFLSINDGVDTDPKLSRWRGLLDLGGASTQVTHRPTTLVGGRALRNGRYGFDMDDEHFTVFSMSYLQYGLDASMRRYKEQLVSDLDDITQVLSPCHNPSYKETYTTEDGRRIGFVGTGDGEACMEVVKKHLLFVREDCQEEGCPNVGRGIRGRLHGDYYAVSAFFYVAFDLGLVDWSGAANLKPSDIAVAGNLYCSNHLPEDADGIEQSTCFNANYAAAVLDAYGLEDYQGGEVTFTRKIEGRNADWTMGAMVYARESATCEASVVR